MSAPSLEVCDPSAEGRRIVDLLREEGFGVRAIDLVDVPLTCADILVLAGDVDGALGALKLLRDEGDQGDVPVVLIGVPAGATHPGEGLPGFGADAVLRRAAPFERLLDKVTFLLDTAAAIPEISRIGLQPFERPVLMLMPDEPESSQVLLSGSSMDDEDDPFGGWVPREPTMQLAGPSANDHDGFDLGDDDEVSMIQEGRAARAQPSAERGASSRPPRPENETGVRPGRRGGSHSDSSWPGTGPTPILDAPQPAIPEDQRAELSPWLADLLAAADRRVFPDRPPLLLHLPAANEAPEQLVPPELFDATFRLDEPVVEDPIDAFTYVGGPAVPASNGAAAGEPGSDHGRSGSAAATPRSELTTATEVPRDHRASDGSGKPPLPSAAPARAEWPIGDPVLGRATADGVRRGTLGPGGALRLLWRVAHLGLDAVCELEPLVELSSAPAPVKMTFLAGELRAFEGPVARTALEGLWRRGRATERPSDEAGAQAALQRHVDAGDLGRFERDRLLREAREGLLSSVVGAERADFVLRPLEDTQPGRTLSSRRVLALPLRAALVDAARDALSEARVRELLGEKAGLALGPAREAALLPAELPSELIDLIARMDGRALVDYLVAAPTEPGLAGLLYALVAGDALVLTDPPADAAPPVASRASVARLIDAAADLALDGDYFAILGLARDANGRDVSRAHHLRRTELSALPLGPLGLSSLSSRRAEAVDAVDEAYRVLANEALRRAYAAAP